MSVDFETRLDRKFRALKQEGRGGLVTFITAGDPDPETSQRILDGLPAAGADVIELGMPFSDPMADGPAIQLASSRALAGGQTMRRTLEMVRRFRQKDRDTPIVLMGYYNPIYVFGVDLFLSLAKEAGVDGLIVVDLPPEEKQELCLPALKAGINFIFLTAPTTTDQRLPLVLEHASGFVYYVSILGITGTASAPIADIEANVKRLKGFTELPVAVGFGVKTPDDARAVAGVSDAAVVGSALVNRITDNLDAEARAKPGLVEAVLGFAAELAAGVRGTEGSTSKGAAQ